MKLVERHRDERGETLVEVLVAIVILGIAGVAIFTGFALSVKSSDLSKKQATSGSYVKSAAEAIQNYVNVTAPSASAGYRSCAPAGYYTGKVSLALPTGYSLTQDLAQAWNGSTWVTCTTALDVGVQRIRLTVNRPTDAIVKGDEFLYLVLRKPCNGSTAGAPCSS